MDWKLFLTVFGTVFVAEIGDKTQLATMLYASDEQTSKTTVLLAAMAALCIAAAIGVLAGHLVGKWVAPQTLRWIAGLGFMRGRRMDVAARLKCARIPPTANRASVRP